MANQKPISKLCPNCHGCTLEFFENDRVVTCYACDETIAVAELLAAPSNGNAATGASATATEDEAYIALAGSVDSPESGLVYLENRFENYNWELYNQTSTILIRDVEQMVEKNKIKQGASPNSWLLDFRSVSIPLQKKLAGRNELAKKMAEMYSAEDNAALMPYFDLYKNITHAMVSNREALVKRLRTDIAFAKKQGLDSVVVGEMETTLTNLCSVLEAMLEVSKLGDVPELIAARKKLDAAKLQEFRAKGIDAEAVYAEAMTMFEAGAASRARALPLLESIRGYADSLEHIGKINFYFDYYKKFYHFFGKYYILEEKTLLPVLDPSGKNKEKNATPPKEEDGYEGKVYNLHEVTQNEPCDEPILKNITRILDFYGSKLFYIKLDKTLCSFDMLTLTETELCVGKKGDFHTANDTFWNFHNNMLYLRKRLAVESIKVGCIGKLMGKKDAIVSRNNNYSLLKVDMANNSCKVAVDRCVDVTECHGTYIFYTLADEKPVEVKKKSFLGKLIPKKAAAKEEQEIKVRLMTYNVENGEKKSVLSENCIINDVYGSKLVYTLYAPNQYNLDLHVLDIVTGEDVLIEKNIYRFFRIIGGRIYYYVGNDDYCPLFSNSFAGDDRVEIMTKIERIVAVRAGWLYAIRGNSRNALLYKISLDGKEKIMICSQFKRSIRITDSYIYYVDSSDSLRVVRSDGKENILIAEDIDAKNVVVDTTHIYYLRNEAVGNRRLSRSLYGMDIDGHNVRKVLFNVVSMMNYDEDTLYVEKADRICYHIFYPSAQKKQEHEETRIFDITRFYRFDKVSGQLDNILTLNLPHPKKYKSKGCLGKERDMEPIFTEIPIKPEYERKGADIGAVLEEQEAEEQQAAANRPTQATGCLEPAKTTNAKAANANNGCNGCMSLFNKH